jgi:hypothetical protein
MAVSKSMPLPCQLIKIHHFKAKSKSDILVITDPRFYYADQRKKILVSLFYLLKNFKASVDASNPRTEHPFTNLLISHTFWGVRFLLIIDGKPPLKTSMKPYVGRFLDNVGSFYDRKGSVIPSFVLHTSVSDPDRDWIRVGFRSPPPPPVQNGKK